MREELDQKLCEKYPKIFVNRHGDVRETAMCWGFACGDGWYNILDILCGCIQDHIDSTQKHWDDTIKYNTMLEEMKAGNFASFDEYYNGIGDAVYKANRKEEMLKEGLRGLQKVCPQLVADQVKEKFGTLRFYCHGGDEYIRGMVRVAESMSVVTCEECGSPGTQRHGGWIRTLCDTHKDEYQRKLQTRMQKDDQREDNYKFVDEDSGSHD